MKTGIPSSPGIGVGKVYVLHEREIPLGRSGPNTSIGSGGTKAHTIRSDESEMERFSRGRRVAETHYNQLIERVRKNIGDDEAEIFEGHLEILTGEDMEDAVREAVLENGLNAELAVIAFSEETAKEFEELDSEYFQQRAGDIRDIGRRLAEAIYYGSITDAADMPDGSVIVAEELTPSATAKLDTDKVAAIATEKGGRTSHAAILARSLAIPCVTGVEDLLDAVNTGQTVLVDGEAGTVETDVSAERLEQVRRLNSAAEQQAEKRRSWSASTPAAFADGTAFGLWSNVSGGKEAETAASYGAGGVGLFRTEFLFMRFSDFPTEEQQADEYRRVCRNMAPNPVIVRLLDCGADKPLNYAYHPEEDNPFLGERGIRFLVNREKRLKAQIAAIAKVHSEGFPIKVMIPMVTSLEEVDQVRSLIPEDAADLPVGIMVETPAAVLCIDALAAKSDFISVGTNDLVQYLLTVDRGNARVAEYYQEFHPAVITALRMIVDGAHRAGIHVGVCGDMASHPETALALLSLGVDEISASVNAIPELKAALRNVSRAQLDGLSDALAGSENADMSRREAESLLQSGPLPWAEAAGS